MPAPGWQHTPQILRISGPGQGVGSRHWEGWGRGAQWPASSPHSWSSFPSTHAWRYLRDPLTSSADLSCLYPELLMPRSWWKPLPLAIEIPSVALFIHPETTALNQPASPMPQNCSPLTPRASMGPTWCSAHGPFPASYFSNLSLSLHLSNRNGIWRYGYIFMSSPLPFRTLPKPEVGWKPILWSWPPGL